MKFRFLTDKEYAVTALAIMGQVRQIPERKTDPTFKSLIRKFDIGPMIRGLDQGVKGKLADVLLDLMDGTLSPEEIAKKHEFTVSVVDQVKQLAEERKRNGG